VAFPPFSSTFHGCPPLHLLSIKKKSFSSGGVLEYVIKNMGNAISHNREYKYFPDPCL
jgi:hypothetical protein